MMRYVVLFASELELVTWILYLMQHEINMNIWKSISCKNFSKYSYTYLYSRVALLCSEWCNIPMRRNIWLKLFNQNWEMLSFWLEKLLWEIPTLIDIFTRSVFPLVVRLLVTIHIVGGISVYYQCVHCERLRFIFHFRRFSHFFYVYIIRNSAWLNRISRL